ncbi:VWFA and cache domain-containing protein 1-like [Branchiostoma lanceolatum]|uniref:VWFA and cache domain-containing protein 1-like n=1 Tax=Branchiostoma lanceolatum TaxID=7740 RepID=UPI0034543A32
MTKITGDDEGDRLMKMMGSYYDFFQSEPEPTFSVPTKDDHLGLTITAAIRTVDANAVFAGVTAVDISMDVVFNEIVNFNLGSYSHAFLVDREDGRVLVHRDLPKPMEWPSDPTFLHLNAMKGALTDDEVTKILNEETGSCSLDNVKVPIARGNAELDGVITVQKKATFYYEPIPGTKYSVVLCLFDEDSIIAVPTSVNPTIDTDSLYHRLDLLNTTTGVCRLYDNYATLDGSTIMFPPEAYSDPIGYLSSLETSEDVENIEQFLNDLSGSVDNPGLVDGVRTDVILTAAIEQYWRESDADSVWRYVGTRNGMFRIFPGIAVDRRYDPTQQAWYMRALSRPQDYTFSRPVPSPFGGGSMVTISRVISHTSSWEILGVTAADITERKYHSLLYMEIPECLSAEFECFLLDDSGYFMELPTAPSMDHEHLTNRFPWLANELVARGEFLMSGWCSSYVNHNSQLYYDTSGFTGLNVTSGPPCSQFSMYPVNNTNTFLLVLPNRHTNSCDDSQIQDCSCDGDCQTCDTNAQSTCQCPCSCAWDYASCTNGILGVLTDVPCPPPRGVQSTQGVGQTDGQPPYQPDSSVHNCEEMCSAQSDNITCEALPHCDWCQELAFPICKETCFPTTPEPTTDATTMETTIKPTTDAITKTTLEPTTTEKTMTIGPSVDCSTMPAGMYPDPQDCTMFYQCLVGVTNAQPYHICGPHNPFTNNCGSQNSSTNTCGSHNSSTNTCGSHNSSSNTCGSHNSSSNTCGSHDAVSNTCGSHNSSTSTCGSHNSSSNNCGSHNSSTNNCGSHNSSTNNCGSHHSSTNNCGSHNSSTNNCGSHNSSTNNCGSHNSSTSSCGSHNSFTSSCGSHHSSTSSCASHHSSTNNCGSGNTFYCVTLSITFTNNSPSGKHGCSTRSTYRAGNH